ncbi:MAG: metallophosphoesterase, partial [Planctomycetota bacterium]
LGIWLGLMTPGPVIVRGLDNLGYFDLAEALAIVLYGWMAVSFWLVVGFGVFDIYNAVLWLGGLARKQIRQAMAPPKLRAWTVTPLVVLATAVGFWEARHPVVRHVRIETPHIPAGRSEVRIVQISDMHLGLHMGPAQLRRVVDEIHQLRPDVLVSTGDLVDSMMHRLNGLSGPLAEIDAPLGKFAVLGNHEYYVGLETSETFHDQAGMKLLRQSWVEPVEGLVIAGVDDPAGQDRGGGESRMDERALLVDVPAERFVLFLKHRPTVEDASAERFDLQLSGHTHGGQFWPWHYITMVQYPYISGLYDLGARGRIYTNPGTGTWGPPIRLLARPEITVITLVRPSGDSEGQPVAAGE